MTVVFDRAGKFVDLKIPKDLSKSAGTLRQLITLAYATSTFLPAGQIAIGDTAAVPLNLPLRLSSQAATPYEGRVITTLRAIDEDGRRRLVRFEQHIESASGTDPIRLTGTGTIDVDLNDGFVTASTIEWTMTGSYAGAGAGAAGPTPVRATLKVTVNAVE